MPIFSASCAFRQLAFSPYLGVAVRRLSKLPLPNMPYVLCCPLWRRCALFGSSGGDVQISPVSPYGPPPPTSTTGVRQDTHTHSWLGHNSKSAHRGLAFQAHDGSAVEARNASRKGGQFLCVACPTLSRSVGASEGARFSCYRAAQVCRAAGRAKDANCTMVQTSPARIPVPAILPLRARRRCEESVVEGTGRGARAGGCPVASSAIPGPGSKVNHPSPRGVLPDASAPDPAGRGSLVDARCGG